MNRPRLFPLASSIALFLSAAHSASADSVGALAFLNEGTPSVSNQTTTGAPLTLQRSGSLGAAGVSSALGYIHIDIDSSSTPLNSAYVNASGNWREDYTISSTSGPQGGSGLANFTFQFDGTFTGGNLGVGNKVQYTLALPIGNVVADAFYDKDGGPFGPLPAGQTFTIAVPFTYGQPLEISASLGAFADPGRGTGFGHAHLTLRQTGFSVVGGNYTSASATGAGRGATFAADDTYAGFNLTNTVGHSSTVSLLGGTAGGNRDLSMSFVAADPTLPSLSDVLDLKGIGGDLFVLQMQYDEAAVIAQFGSEAALQLSWFNITSQTWENAVTGNSAGTSTRIDRAYNPLTDYVLGNWGQDTAKNTVWAVIDHNSEFTVAAAIPAPEPGSSLLLELGALLVLSRRRNCGRSDSHLRS